MGTSVELKKVVSRLERLQEQFDRLIASNDKQKRELEEIRELLQKQEGSAGDGQST